MATLSNSPPVTITNQAILGHSYLFADNAHPRSGSDKNALAQMKTREISHVHDPEFGLQG